jgi:acyl-CoA-dependent ceramide synthase
MNLLILLGLAHLFFPRARTRTRKFFNISYRDAESGLYARGWDDMYLVFFYIVVFTGMRATVMHYMLMPLAKMSGIRSKKGKTRFAEQAWLLLYCTVFWTLGMVRNRELSF